MATRTICVATATRAEYGLLRWVMRELLDDPAVTLQCLVTGAHLSPTHGSTYRDIERDGFRIDAKVEMLLASDSEVAIAKAMGLCSIGVADALAALRPDILVVLGDRYELLPICGAATVMNVPVAHVSGGDITEGAIDNQVRHGVTKLAHLHFAGTEESGARIVQMGEEPSRVFVVGEPGLDNFVRVAPIPRADLARSLGLAPGSRWVIFTYHPETAATIEVDRERVEAALDALGDLPGVEVMMTYPNADRGGLELAAMLEARRAADGRFKLVKSLGQDRFVGLMREAWVMVGNSSAGIVEAPSVRLPSIDIGDRQRGRPTAPSTLRVDGTKASIAGALARVDDPAFRAGLAGCVNPYGDGKAARRIKEVLATVPLEPLLRKPFHAPDRR